MTEKVIVIRRIHWILHKKLIKEGYSVLGLDINDYYDKDLKLNRLDNLKSLLQVKDRWQFINAILKMNIIKKALIVLIQI